MGYRKTILPNHPDRLSDVLIELSSKQNEQRISLGELMEALCDRAIAAMMLIFALPNVVPTPPGTSVALGVPLVILSAQLLFGLSPWLPKFIANRSLPRSAFKAVIDRAAPWLRKSERVMRPRIAVLSCGPAQRLIGALCLVLAVVLALPIPLGNILPALAICILALGVLERDGVWILLGVAIAGVAIGLLAGMFYGVVRGLAASAQLWN